MEHSVDEKVEHICREYLTAMADMRDLTAKMETESRTEFKDPLATILYVNGTKMIAREILRLATDSFFSEIAVIKDSINEHDSPRFDPMATVDTYTVKEQSEELGLALIEPNRKRGLYSGPVVGLDHRAALIKICPTKSVELPFSELDQSLEKLQIGDTVHVAFDGGKLVVRVRVSERNVREGEK